MKWHSSSCGVMAGRGNVCVCGQREAGVQGDVML